MEKLLWDIIWEWPGNEASTTPFFEGFRRRLPLFPHRTENNLSIKEFSSLIPRPPSQLSVTCSTEKQRGPEEIRGMVEGV